MDSYQEETYGQRVASIYDEWFADYDPAAIETLKELAQGGRALELGIGTGRIALLRRIAANTFRSTSTRLRAQLPPPGRHLGEKWHDPKKFQRKL